MKTWFQHDFFKRTFKNTAILASGKLIGGIFDFIALLCITHTLSADDFGVYILLNSYFGVIICLSNFETWQIVLHYATIPLKNKQLNAVINAIRFSFGLDLTTAIIGTIIGIALILFFANVFHIQPQHAYLAIFNTTHILFCSDLATMGVMRLLNEVKSFAYLQTLQKFLNFIFSFLLFFLHGSLFYFILALYISNVITQGVRYYMTWKVLKKHQLKDAFFPSLKAARLMPHGIWSFAWSSSIKSIIYSLWKPASNLIIGDVLGNSMTGLYDIASKLIKAVQAPFKLMEKNYYPEIVRLDPRDKLPWIFTAKILSLSLLIGFIGMIVIHFFGVFFIELIGYHYHHAQAVLTISALAIPFMLFADSLESILFTSGKATYLTLIETFSACIYIFLLYKLSFILGINGAALAYTIGQALIALLIFCLAFYTYINRDKIIPPHEHKIN